MKNKVQLSIQNPCHQNWQQMTVAEKGKFCSFCKKNVIDFTMQSDTSILNSLKENMNMCGRFLPSQLDRVLVERAEKSVYWQIGLASFLVFLGLGSQTSFAQGRVRVETKKDSLKKPKEILKVINEFTLSGIVVDATNIAVAGANVTNQRNAARTQTDLNGRFKIQVATDDNLIVKFTGMDALEYCVQDCDRNISPINLIMQELPALLGGFISVQKKPSFFRKITRPFRKFFKKKKCTTS